MGFFCIVKGCDGAYRIDSSLKFFRFPVNCQTTKNLWWKLSGQKFVEPTAKEMMDKARFCSKHFPPSYHSWVCQQLGWQKKPCKCSPKGLLPSLNLPESVATPEILQEIAEYEKNKKLNKQEKKGRKGKAALPTKTGKN